ncbi:AMP-binding protein [uncultured Sphaerochaeta sp.]|uniref:AMP-dependent synthetase/ligase n=1 Tax=uncultured Sphaerochaeta sp. TaxID=886478 RepID=UPI002A0A3699|nr:AMP-binding protein [uncultured Sphaerochaeta sp.]
MANKKGSKKPWDFLEEFRGKDFQGEWPTIVELFNISVKRYPDNRCYTAFVPTKETFTYSEVHTIVKQIGNYLVSHGVKKGDKIAVSGKNSPEWTMAYLGILYAGAIVVPLDCTFHDAEMKKLLAFADVTKLFADADRLKTLDPKNTLALTDKISLEPCKDFPFILDCQVKEEQETEKSSTTDTAAILFTSGTTGTPKGVMLSHRNLVSDALLAQGNMWIYPTDVFYAILPIHHAYTMLSVFFVGMSSGAEVVFGKKLVISQVLKEIKEGHVTMFLGVPMLFNKMIGGLMHGVREKGLLVYGAIRFLMGISGFLKKVFKVNVGKKMFGFLLEKLSLDTNRICISGGGPLPASTFKMFNELGIDFVQGYGLTETSPITHLNPVEAYIETSVGKKIPGAEVKIINPDAEGNGIICIKGSMVMQGYYKNPEATAEVMDGDWLITGDVGHQDAKGYLYLTGREKNVIVTAGGKNVFPEEVEDYFQLHDEIDTICVCKYTLDAKAKSEGIRALIYPSQTYFEKIKKENGESAKAIVEKRMQEIVSEVNKELQNYKKITRVQVVDEPFEMTSTKKVKRFVVEQKYKD